MGQGMTDRLAGLSAGNARAALLGATSLAVLAVAVGLVLTGVTSGEVAATVLFLPVFGAGLLGGRPVGYAGAAVASIAYVGLRRADLAAAGAANAGVLTLTRAGAFLVAGHVGALAQALIPGGAAATGPRARPGRDGRRPAAQRARGRPAPAQHAWDEPWPTGDREPAPALDRRRRVLAGVGSPAGGGDPFRDDDRLLPTTMSNGWPPPGPEPWPERDERRAPPDDVPVGDDWGQPDTAWQDAPGWQDEQPGHGQAPRWPADGDDRPAADDSWAAVQESWRRQQGDPPDDEQGVPAGDQRWPGAPPGGPGEPQPPDPWAGQAPAADPWGGGAPVDDRWGPPSGEEAALLADPWSGGASVDDRWEPPSGQQAAVQADPWGPPTGETWAAPAEAPGGGWHQPVEVPGGAGWSPDPAPGGGPVPDERWDEPHGEPAERWDAPAADPWTSTGQTDAIWDDPATGHVGAPDQWSAPAEAGWAAAGAGAAGAVGAMGGHPARTPAPAAPEPSLPAVDHETGLWTARFLRDRLLAERERSRRSGRPFSLVLVQVPDGPLAQLPYRRQITLLRELGYQFVAGGVVDHLVHVPDQAQHWFAVILPDTDRSGAQVLERRLRLGIGGYLSSRGLPLRDLESASLTAPDDDPAMGTIWEALIGPEDRGSSMPYDY